MRDVPTRLLTRFATGCFWLAVLFVLPNCSFSKGLAGEFSNVHPGYPPTDVVLCDIPKALGTRCATSADKTTGIYFRNAAIALNEGRTSNVGLDDSPTALAKCGGDPEATVFEGAFPQGYPVCFNCGVLGAPPPSGKPADYYAADKTGVCRQQCYDFYGSTSSDGIFSPDMPPIPSVKAFCDTFARVSTNYPTDSCIQGGCNSTGLVAWFEDPRILPEPIQWTDKVKTNAYGFDLFRDQDTTGNWDGGAASTQWITHGDAFFEFGVTRNHRTGLAELPVGCSPPCPDGDPGLGDIDFAFEIGSASDPHIYIFEYGQKIPGLDFNGSFGSYTSGERFRIYVRENGDGTATVSYRKFNASCHPGMVCDTNLLYTSSARPRYPFRVDTSIQEKWTGVLGAQLVYIH